MSDGYFMQYVHKRMDQINFNSINNKRRRVFHQWLQRIIQMALDKRMREYCPFFFFFSFPSLAALPMQNSDSWAKNVLCSARMNLISIQVEGEPVNFIWQQEGTPPHWNSLARELLNVEDLGHNGRDRS